MFALARPKIAIAALSAFLLAAPAAFSGTADLSGSIAGLVRDSRGVPQMGASVLLFNRSERLIEQAITNDRGLFGFAALTPDLYSVRVSLASFVPAIKQKIAVQPGMQSLLYVDLASVLSSIELVYAAPGQGALMSDEWKWTLKASASTRPILRLLPDSSVSDPSHREGTGVFSETRGLLNVSAGDPGSLGGSTSQSDLGTGFALATSMFGRNQLKVSGNVGYNPGSAIPATGFRTSFSRDGIGPEIAVTVQQIYLPSRASFAGQVDGAPALRTTSVSMHDRLALLDNLLLEYGASLDSVSFLNHLNYLSKFARLSYDVGSLGRLQAAYSSGAPPVYLMVDPSLESASASVGDSESLAQDLNALSLLPRVSLLDGHAAVQRTQDFEFGYEKRFTSTTLNFTGYYENVTNAAMTVLGQDGVFAIGDVLPDISSRSSILDGGSFHRSGFAASAAEDLGDRVQVGVSFGSSGALFPNQQGAAATADDLRSNLQTTQRFWASARASAKLPLTGTQITGSYQWMDYHDTIMPDHFYLTQNLYLGPGLNVLIRQPIPSLFGMPGRLEATAEVRNGLAQGYLPIVEGGQRVTLVQSPRALRGGLSFIF